MLGVIEGESHNGIVSALSVDSINLLLRVQISLLLFLFYPPPRFSPNLRHYKIADVGGSEEGEYGF